MRTYAERRCPVCKKNVSALLHDYGEITPENFNEKFGMNDLIIQPIKCPKCGQEGFPEYMTLYDGDKPIDRAKIGSRELPIVGGNVPYGVVHTHEEQAELERGMAKVMPLFEKQGENFWDGYCKFALENWKEHLIELTPNEFADAYQMIGWQPLSDTASVASWRRDASKRLTSDQNRAAFWRAANLHLIGEFLWDGDAPSWPVKKWAQEFGRSRVTYIVLHFPLPEELESVRSEKLSLVIRKKSGDTGVLFERIGYLGKELDKQRRRSEEMSTALLELRLEKAAVEEDLGRARREIQAIKNQKIVYERDTDDIRKVQEFKGLIRELRTEVKRLESLLPEPEKEPEEIEETAEEIIKEEPVSLDVLKGKTVAMFGILGERRDVSCRVVWHDGDQVDQALERLALDADVYVVLTRFISHEAMWRLKELAIDMDKPILFSRGTNTDIILTRVARLIHAK